MFNFHIEEITKSLPLPPVIKNLIIAYNIIPAFANKHIAQVNANIQNVALMKNGHIAALCHNVDSSLLGYSICICIINCINGEIINTFPLCDLPDAFTLLFFNINNTDKVILHLADDNGRYTLVYDTQIGKLINKIYMCGRAKVRLLNNDTLLLHSEKGCYSWDYTLDNLTLIPFASIFQTLYNNITAYSKDGFALYSYDGKELHIFIKQQLLRTIKIQQDRKMDFLAVLEDDTIIYILDDNIAYLDSPPELIHYDPITDVIIGRRLLPSNTYIKYISILSGNICIIAYNTGKFNMYILQIDNLSTCVIDHKQYTSPIVYVGCFSNEDILSLQRERILIYNNISKEETNHSESNYEKVFVLQSDRILACIKNEHGKTWHIYE